MPRPHPRSALGLLRALLLVAVLVCAPRAQAASYDPDLTWRTLVTEHYRIHFHQGIEAVAERFSQQVEAIHATMQDELKWRLRMKVDLVLVDRTDAANGFATAVPYNAITIFVTAPTEDSTLSLYDDWGETIFTHELTHVIHMETNRGIVRAARAVVGRIASTNMVSPPWIIEGLATFQETRHTPGGRGRSAYVDMIKRAAVTDEAWPPLGNLDGYQADPPAGNLRYLFGQDFMQYIADQAGDDAWTRWIHRYGGSLPYILPAKRTFGQNLRQLYRGWRSDRITHYEDQVAALSAEGIREGTLISDGVASCSAPSFSPDDRHLVWSCMDRARGPAIWRAEADGSGAEILKKKFGARNFTWRRDSKAFVYAATHVVNRFNTWSDIFIFDLASKSVRTLTRGARARDPDFSADGRRLVMVTNRAGTNQLEVMTVDQVREPLTHHDDQTQYSTPRFSPDGAHIAVSVHQQGQRDLWLFRDDATPLRRITDDAAIDRDPAWSPDGRYLFFSSDRTGIPNIYAIELATERLWQVTNVRTGAARPAISADGERMAYEQYSALGWDVRMMALDPSQWLDRGVLPRFEVFDADLPGYAPPPRPSSAPPPPLFPAVPGAAPAPEGPAAHEAPAPPTPPSPSPPPALFPAPPDASVSPATPRPAAPATTALHASDPNLAWVGEPLRRAGYGPAFAPGPGAEQSVEGTDTFVQIEAGDVYGDEKDYPFTIKPRRYNPLPSLLPRYWLPAFQSTPRLPDVPPVGPFAFLQRLPAPFNLPGLSVQATTGASDPVRHHSWSAFVAYRTDANFVSGGGGWTINRWLPVFRISGQTQAVPRTYQLLDPEAADAGELAGGEALRTYFERRVGGSLTMNYPFTPQSTIFATYDFNERRALSELDAEAYLPSVALQGTVGQLSAGYRYAWFRPTPYAISQEDGRTFSIVGSVIAPWLGTFEQLADGTRQPLTQAQVSAELREYVDMPWAPNHVLAFRVAAGAAVGAGRRLVGNYQVGGVLGEGAFYVRPPGYRMVRGYPFGARRGDSYWLAGMEYRLPLWRMDRGVGTLPAFFRALSAAAYIDAGNALVTVTHVGDLVQDALVGVGVELRLSTILGWAGRFDGRLGYGVGLTRTGFGPIDPRTIYFQLGGAF